jgi:hypothetical protein
MPEPLNPKDRKFRRHAKEWTVADFLGRGKQGAEQVAYIQQLLNPSDPSMLNKLTGLLQNRKVKSSKVAQMLKARGGVDLAKFRKA